MGTRQTYSRTLMRACIVAGDEAALARQLRVPEAAVVGWLLGETRVPDEIFLRAVDFLIARNEQRTKDVDSFVAQVRKRHQWRHPKEQDKS
jgi:DNA-binding transcriptional regulator YdaS (Cro superfamily)